MSIITKIKLLNITPEDPFYAATPEGKACSATEDVVRGALARSVISTEEDAPFPRYVRAILSAYKRQNGE